MPLLLLLVSVGGRAAHGLRECHNLLVRAPWIDSAKSRPLRARRQPAWIVIRQARGFEAALLATVSASGFVLADGRCRPHLAEAAVGAIPDHIPLDASVLLFTFGVGATVALLVRACAAPRMTQPDLNRVLQAGGRRTTGGARVTRDVWWWLKSRYR